MERSADGWKTYTTSSYDKRGNLILETYYKNKKAETAGEYTFDETNKMVEGVNANGEQSIYSYNGLGALMENTWIIAKNGYGYHDVSATAVVDGEVVVDADTGKRQQKVRLTPEELEAANAAEEAAIAAAAAEAEKAEEAAASDDETDAEVTNPPMLLATGNQVNGNETQDKPTGSDVKKTSTVVKEFVVDFSREDYKPLMEHEVNGLTYRYVNSDKARLSVVVQGIETGSSSLLDANGELHAYYHADYLGTTDYLTSAVNSKVISWTSYNEWGEITHNAVLKCGKRELDLVKEYATHDYDAVLDLYYAKARFYDAYNRTFTAQDPILDPSQYDMREYVKEPMALVQYLYVKANAVNWIDPLGLKAATIPQVTLTPEMQQAIDEHRIYDAGTITYQGEKYDIYVPTISGDIVPPNFMIYDAADNSSFALNGYDDIYRKSTNFTFTDWAKAIANPNASPESQYVEGNKLVPTAPNLDAGAGVATWINQIANATSHFNIRVTLYESHDKQRRFAVIEITEQSVAELMKENAGGYNTVFTCDYSMYYKFSFDEARSEDPYINYLYKQNGQMLAYMKKYEGDNIQLFKQKLFTEDELVDVYGSRYTKSLYVNSGLDEKIKLVLDDKFRMEIS